MIRTRFIYVLTALLAICSCEERTPDLFMDMTGVYFNNKSAQMAVTDSLNITFVYEASDRMEVPVKVQLIGRTSDHDRPLDITVVSDNAVEGVDYLLPSAPVLPAGASEMDYTVTLLRNEALKSQRKMMTLELHGNEYFDLPVKEIQQIADTVSVLTLRIYFSDMFTQAPAAWETNLLGEFTQQKFELICKVLNINPADFNDPSLMTLAKQLYISSEMTAYVQEEIRKKNAGEPYDVDVLDRESDEPLMFR